jgi:hypothetical protein
VWRSIAPTLAAVAILLLAQGMLGMLLPLRWLGSGMDSTTISAIAAAHYLGMLLGSFYGLDPYLPAPRWRSRGARGCSWPRR